MGRRLFSRSNPKLLFAPIRTVGDARDERYREEDKRDAQLARLEARNAEKLAKAKARFEKTKAGREIANDRALRWIPPQYPGGAAEWRLNNMESI